MKTIGVLLALVMLQEVTAQRAPSISYISQKQIKNIGEAVELRCSIQHEQEYPVVWMKKNGADQVPISSRDTLILPDSRFSLRYDVKSSTYTLGIKEIQETDAGFYECQVVIDMNTKNSAIVELRIRTPPVISNNSTRSKIANEGSQLRLECFAGGIPPPNITWRRENNAVLPIGGFVYHGNVFEIKPVRKEDRGNYYCIADNGVGQGTRRIVNVQVGFAPIVTAPQPRLGQALQYDMDLVCRVEAYPPPDITWYKDGFQLSNDRHHVISNSATDEAIETIIRIVTIDKVQYGGYVCKAANSLGADETTIELYEMDIPVCPPACK